MLQIEMFQINRSRLQKGFINYFLVFLITQKRCSHSQVCHTLFKRQLLSVYVFFLQQQEVQIKTAKWFLKSFPILTLLLFKINQLRVLSSCLHSSLKSTLFQEQQPIMYNSIHVKRFRSTSERVEFKYLKTSLVGFRYT